MLVFIQKNLAILSVPKTGTTAYVAALRRRASVVISSPPGLKHTNLIKFQRSFLPIFQNATHRPIETMAVVREPIDWLGSWYRYRQRDQLDGHENSTKGVSFDEFVIAYLEKERPKFAQVGDMANFVKPAKDHAPITHLFKYDAQESIHAFLQTRLGFDFDLERRNVSPKAKLSLDPAIKAQLMEKCADQFTLWDRAQG